MSRPGSLRFAPWVLACSLLGCRHQSPPPSRFPTAEALLTRMKETFACERGVRGEAKVDQFTEQGRVRGKVLLFAVRPRSLRMDLESPPPFQSIVSTLTSDGERFTLLDVRAKRFWHGPAKSCNIARLTQVPLEPHALVTLLGGQAPLLVEAAPPVLEWSGEGYYIVRIPSTREASEELHLTPMPSDFEKPWHEQRLRVLQVGVRQQGVLLYQADLSDHRTAATAPPLVDPDGLDPPLAPSGPSCNVEVPRRVHIEVPPTGQDILFNYQDLALNPPLPADVFHQSAPAGAESVSVDCPETFPQSSRKDGRAAR